MQLDQALALIRDIPDFPKPGILFKDITPLLSNAEAFALVTNVLAGDHESYTQVAGVEARGFILASAVAIKSGKGFVPIRKAGKLPHTTISKSYGLEYGVDVIEAHIDAVQPGERILLIDDVLATGGTLIAALEILQELEAEISEVVVLYEIQALQGRARILDKFPHISVRAIVSE